MAVAVAARYRNWNSNRPDRIAQETVVVECVFEPTGESRRVSLPLDITPEAAAHLLQEQIRTSSKAGEVKQLEIVPEPRILVDGRVLTGTNLKAAGVREGSRLNLASSAKREPGT